MTQLENDLLEALRVARAMLAEVCTDYMHPNFTDRHQAGPRIRAAIKTIDVAMVKVRVGKRVKKK